MTLPVTRWSASAQSQMTVPATSLGSELVVVLICFNECSLGAYTELPGNEHSGEQLDTAVARDAFVQLGVL